MAAKAERHYCFTTTLGNYKVKFAGNFYNALARVGAGRQAVSCRFRATQDDGPTEASLGGLGQARRSGILGPTVVRDLVVRFGRTQLASEALTTIGGAEDRGRNSLAGIEFSGPHSRNTPIVTMENEICPVPPWTTLYLSAFPRLTLPAQS